MGWRGQRWKRDLYCNTQQGEEFLKHLHTLLPQNLFCGAAWSWSTKRCANEQEN